ncbi:MAG: class I SAM-dependent methyltransferase, partial [bacterium]
MAGFIVGIILIVIFVPMLIAGRSGAPWVPMKKRDIERVNNLANLKSGMKFIELGSGDGRLCHYIARGNPSVQVIGVELSWPVFLLSKVRMLVNPQNNLKIFLGNAHKSDISNKDVIFFYMLPRSMEKWLKMKLIKEMKPGSKAIS